MHLHPIYLIEGVISQHRFLCSSPREQNQFFFLKFDDEDSAFGDKFANAVPLQSRIAFMYEPLYIFELCSSSKCPFIILDARSSHCPDRPEYILYGASPPTISGKPSRRVNYCLMDTESCRKLTVWALWSFRAFVLMFLIL